MTHKLQWDLDRSPNLSQKPRPNNIQKKKKNLQIVDFGVPAEHRIKVKDCDKKDKNFDLARELKKYEHEGDNYYNCGWCFRYSNKRIIKGTGGLGNWQTSGDHPNYSIVENGQNTEEIPGDLRRLAVTQTLVKDHQLKLM